MKTINACLMGLAIVAVLSGCSRGITSEPGDAPNLQKWVESANSQKPEPLDPLPTLTKFEAVPYTVATERDPFDPKMMADSSSTTQLRPDDSRPKHTLETFALDSLKMVGTMGAPNGRLTGLVQAPDKIVYRVNPGNYMGQSDGRVSAVFEDRIELIEVVSDGAGGWMERPATIALEEM